MCGQHNARASVEDNTGQNRDKGHTPYPRTEIKIPDSAGNRTRVAGVEFRDSTDHATATDIVKSILKIVIHVLKFVHKCLNVLLRNLMCMEHFKICILKLN